MRALQLKEQHTVSNCLCCSTLAELPAVREALKGGINEYMIGLWPLFLWKQESPADAVKPARRKSMQKLLQFDVFRFMSPNSIS